MSIEIVGLLAGNRRSEEDPQAPSAFDPEFLREYARTYEAAGFDRVLIGQNARSVDSLTIAAWAAACTQRLRLMIAHRPGFIAPTMAARALATLDQLSGGRVGVHIITAANDAETRNDGDHLTKDDRYHRSREYVEVLRKVWSATSPFDHKGAFYDIEGALSEVRPAQPSIPIFWGGSSELGIDYGAALADVYALGGGSVAQVGDLIQKVRAKAAAQGRTLRYSMSMRIVLGASRDQAWGRARRLLETVETQQAKAGLLGRDLGEYQDRRMLAANEAAEVGADPYLWNGLTLATRGRTQAMCLVGTPDDVVEGLTAYYRTGIDNFLISGFDLLADTAWIGRDVIPALRAATQATPRQPTPTTEGATSA